MTARKVAGVVAAVGIVAGVGGGLIGARVQAAPPCPTVSFAPADGWNTVETTYGTQPDALPVAWAANVPFRSEDSYQGFPMNTIADLPPQGIVITATQPRKYSGGVPFPALDFPLSLDEGHFVADDYEGQPGPHVSNYIIDTWVDGKLLNVMVWMGTNQPTSHMATAANEELARLCVPAA